MNFVNILVRVLEYGCQPWNLTDGAPAAWLHRRHRRSAQVAKEPSAAKDQGTDQLYCKEWTPFKRRLHLFSLSRCSRSGPCHFTRWPFSLTPQGPFYLVYRNPMDHETTPRNEGWWKGLKDFLIMHSVSFLFEKTFSLCRSGSIKLWVPWFWDQTLPARSTHQSKAATKNCLPRSIFSLEKNRLGSIFVIFVRPLDNVARHSRVIEDCRQLDWSGLWACWSNKIATVLERTNVKIKN